MRIQRKYAIPVIMTLILAVGAIILLGKKPITDPNNPKFNPMKFRFENYKDAKEICQKREGSKIQFCKSELDDIMAKIFPSGTKKEYVDKILIFQAGAKPQSYTAKPNTVIYRYEVNTSMFVTTIWSVYVSYDQKNETKNIYATIGHSGF